MRAFQDFKYKHMHRYEWLCLPSPWGDVQAQNDAEDLDRRQQRAIDHPRLAQWADIGRQFAHPYHWPPSQQPKAMDPVERGTCRVQVLRSAADWSHGVLLEDSIQRQSSL
jgi:phospholipase D1/2